MSKKETKTNAMRILDDANIPYTIHTYEVEDGMIDGVSVAQKCGEDPEQVFKTLVCESNTKEHFVFVIPVGERLNLKECAKAVGMKNVEMIPQKELLKTTGYIHGGCSPIGMKKKFVTVFDETIILFDKIMVSGGRVGTQVEVNVEDLLRITDGLVKPLTQE